MFGDDAIMGGDAAVGSDDDGCKVRIFGRRFGWEIVYVAVVGGVGEEDRLV